MSRSRLPDALKAQRGTLRKCRTNPTAPTPPIVRLEPREWLSPETKAVFCELADIVFEMGVSAAADVYALEQLAQQLKDWRELTAFLNANGHYYDAGGKQKRYPQSRIRNTIERNMRGSMADFGLTPKHRERLLRTE